MKKGKKGNGHKNLKKFWKLGIRDFNTHYFDINANDHLTVKEGNYQYDLIQLVKKYGSPTEIFFPYILEERLEELINLFNSYIKISRYPGKFFYHYPMKVNQNKEFILPLVTEGANLETGSANELRLVQKMWNRGNLNKKIKVLCNGPKTKEYLDLITELKKQNLDIIPIIEDTHEYNYLAKYRGNVGIRLDVDARVSSHWDRTVDRFGLSEQEIKRLGKIKNLKVLHYHIGSQIETLSDILKPIRKSMEVYAQLKKINPSLDTLDIGGGMPIPYDRKYKYSVDTLIKDIIKFISHFCEKNSITPPNIACEWGRYIVAPAQVTIYRVICEKEIAKSKRKWYVIDGSFMNDLLDTWAIHQKWHVVPANYMNSRQRVQTWLAGMSCDSDDKYTGQQSYVLLPQLPEETEGEDSLYLAIFDSGAYQDALASHHCLLSSPVKLLANNAEIKIIRRKETADDVARLFGW